MAKATTKTGGAQRGRRNNSDPESTRRDILQAAVEVLAKDGPESLTVSEVARRAEVNRGTAYQHFPTREDLAHATAEWVGQRMYDEFFGDFKAVAKENEFYPPALAQQRLSKFAMENPELGRAWLYDVMTSTGEVTDKFWKEYVKRLQQFIDNGHGRQDIDVEVYAFVTLVTSMMWPIWADAHSRSKKARGLMEQRFIDEMLRLTMFGALVPEQHPDLQARYGNGKKPA